MLQASKIDIRNKAEQEWTELKEAQDAADEEEDRVWLETHADASSLEKRMHKKAMEMTRNPDANPERVPDDWERYAPTAASAVADLDGAVFLMNTSLVVTYRAADARCKSLSFLFEAYEPRCWYFESVECIRRLALTGLLVFFAVSGPQAPPRRMSVSAPLSSHARRNQDGTVFQIIVASLISILSMVIYGALGPFLDDSADAVATFCQLMTCVHDARATVRVDTHKLHACARSDFSNFSSPSYSLRTQSSAECRRMSSGTAWSSSTWAPSCMDSSTRWPKRAVMKQRRWHTLRAMSCRPWD